MLPYHQQFFGNPSSSHLYGQRAAMAVQKARLQVARLLSCSPETLFFTSGATESIHFALSGWTLAQNKDCHIITTTIEHKATYGASQLAERLGAKVSLCTVDSEGFINVEHLKKQILPGQKTLVSLIHGQNEIGTVQDLEKIVPVLKQNPNVFIHVDAAQSLGKIPISLNHLAIDFLSLSGHKIYGPKGVGALFARDIQNIHPLFSGGGQEMSLRAGTHNVAGIVGLGRACEWFLKNFEQENARLRSLQSLFFELLSPLQDHIEFHGSLQQRLPHNIHFSLRRKKLEDIMDLFDSFALSSGSACSSMNKRDPSHVLLALGVLPEQAQNAVRVGLGSSSNKDHVHSFCEMLIQLLKK